MERYPSDCFSPVSNDRLAEGLEFYLSRLEDSGSLALSIMLSFLESPYSFLLYSKGLEDGLYSLWRRLINFESSYLISICSLTYYLSLLIFVIIYNRIIKALKKLFIDHL